MSTLPRNEIERLLDFCKTDVQVKSVKAWLECGSLEKAAKELNINNRSLRRNIARIRKYAESLGYDPKAEPEGLDSGCVEMRRTEDGEWQKVRAWTRPDKTKESVGDILEAALDGIKDNIPKFDKIKADKLTRDENLLNLYVLTDVHLGMLAWEREGGEDWDLEIAEKTILAGFDYLIKQSPNAHTGFFCNLGDFMHYDGMLAMTNASGHILDSDTRPYKLIKAASRICRAIIKMMLKKYKKVIVLSCQGNHDEKSSMFLMDMLSVAYEKNKRVEIIDEPKPHYVYIHGKIMLGFHHGHKLRGKLRDLKHKFDDEFRHMLGETTLTLIHTGHYHEWKVDGNVEQHPTIAARDSYTSNYLYNSPRAMRCITYDKFRGEKSRITFNP